MIHKEKLHIGTWTILKEGIRRGYRLLSVNSSKSIFAFVDSNSLGFKFKFTPGHLTIKSRQDYPAITSKRSNKRYMQESKMPVPSTYFMGNRVKELRSSLSNNPPEFPLVVKPNTGSISENVFTNIENESELIQKALLIEKTNQEILVEQHITGKHYRILIIDGTYIGCVERRPASITGDGKHTIQELISLRNQELNREGRKVRHTTNHHLVFDKTSNKILRARGLNANHILNSREYLEIQEKITAELGADYIDVTENLNVEVIKRCIQLQQNVGHYIVGVDMISSDIAALPDSGLTYFNEYNLAPFIDLHENNNIGTQRNASGAIWDYLEENRGSIMDASLPDF